MFLDGLLERVLVLPSISLLVTGISLAVNSNLPQVAFVDVWRFEDESGIRLTIREHGWDEVGLNRRCSRDKCLSRPSGNVFHPIERNENRVVFPIHETGGSPL